MASPERRPRKNLRAQLEREVVAPLFEDLAPATLADASIPEIVLRNRRNRARERVLDALASRGSAEVPEDLLREARRLVRRWAAAGFNDGFSEAEDFEIRCAREHDLVVAQESGDMELVLEVYEKEYRWRVTEQFGRIELRGIQTAHRVLQDLEKVYVPLHLEPRPEEVESENGKVVTLLARSRIPVLEILREYRQILMVGAPGSGKSTLAGYLAMRAATGQLANEIGEEREPLPFVVTVRALREPSLTPRGIADHVGCPVSVVQRALQQKRIFLLIDGLDEAPQGIRELFVDMLLRFAAKQAEARIVVTSRPTGPPGAVEESLPNLQPFVLKELTEEEVSLFIDKWCLAAEISVRKEVAEAEKEATKAAADLKRRLSLSYAVQKVATNPLLTTILCVVHRFLGRTIPEHRVTLYQKCTDALLYEWDQAKFPEGAAVGHLDADAKRHLLTGIARTIHERHAAEIREREVIHHFSEKLPDLGRPASDAKRIIEEIRDRSGLLVERRPGYFAFSHLTFQEYLCALDFMESKATKDLVTRYKEPWWHEVIVLAAGSPGGFGGEIAWRLLGQRTVGATLLAAQCLETDVAMPLHIRERIESGVQKLIPPRNFSEANSLATLGIIAAPSLAKALPGKDADAAVFILYALKDIDYAPVIPSITRCASDTRTAKRVTLGGLISGAPIWNPTVGAFAAFVIAQKLHSSELARGALKEALHQLELPEVELLAKEFRLIDGPGEEIALGVLAARRRSSLPASASGTGK